MVRNRIASFLSTGHAQSKFLSVTRLPILQAVNFVLIRSGILFHIFYMPKKQHGVSSGKLINDYECAATGNDNTPAFICHFIPGLVRIAILWTGWRFG